MSTVVLTLAAGLNRGIGRKATVEREFGAIAELHTSSTSIACTLPGERTLKHLRQKSDSDLVCKGIATTPVAFVGALSHYCCKNILNACLAQFLTDRANCGLLKHHNRTDKDATKLTADDEARLREDFRKPSEPDCECELFPQPRPNVLFEAGMAMAHFPNRTILVRVGRCRPFSDIAGIRFVEMGNSIEKRRDLAKRLRMAACATIDLESSTGWQTEGNFSVADSPRSLRNSF